MDDKLKKIYNNMVKERDKELSPLTKPVEEVYYTGKKEGINFCIALIEKGFPELKEENND